jgi:hypothetical protein
VKLGKAPPTYDKRDLQLAQFRTAKTPKHPATFGHEKAVKQWGMLGNDNWGDCVFAGAAHETMLWNAEVKRSVKFTDGAVLGDYSAVTGFDPHDRSTDEGTVVRDALNYRRHLGVRDADGERHKLGAYVSLEPGDYDQLLEAAYLFSAVGIGFEFPESAWDQFDAEETWTVVPGAQIEGGHYVPIVARRHTLLCVTWGRVQRMSKKFYEKFCDEAWALLSPEFLADGKSPEGYDLAVLRADLTAL